MNSGPFLSQRVGLFVVVALLHVGLALGFVQLGSERKVPLALQSIEAHFVSAMEEPSHSRAIPHVDVVPLTMNLNVEEPRYEIVAPPVSTLVSIQEVNKPAAQPITTDAPVLIEAVEYMSPPAPRYPQLSRRLKEEGTVVLKVLVDERGEAANVEVADSSGFERLDQAAVEAVASATFRPYVENGAARAVFVLIPIEFGLKRAKG